MQLHLAVTQQNESGPCGSTNASAFVIYGNDPARPTTSTVAIYDDYLMVLRLDEGSTESEE